MGAILKFYRNHKSRCRVMDAKGSDERMDREVRMKWTAKELERIANSAFRVSSQATMAGAGSVEPGAARETTADKAVPFKGKQTTDRGEVTMESRNLHKADKDNCSLGSEIMAPTVLFYRVKDAWGCFSNFAPYPIILKGVVWPTVEHYFQAQKFSGTSLEEEMRLEKSPMKVARMGRDRTKKLREDWDAVKDDIMREALRAKFLQHPDLRDILLSTGDAEIVEHTPNDNYWADGGDGSGQNLLGKMLMEIRALIREGML